MKLLITGASGQLGTVLQEVLPDATAASSKELDIGDADAVRSYVESRGIEAIVNCAAYTAVDKAEDEPEKAERVNAVGAGNLARCGLPMVHISTDYVFDGTAEIPYSEKMATAPASVYGMTKLRGECEVLGAAPIGLVIRTSWLYSAYGTNFVKTMLRLGKEKSSICVVADQVGTPTSCRDLANAIAVIIPRLDVKLSGIYHFSNEGQCSWYDFAVEIMARAGLQCAVEPIASDAYPTRAKRPRFSVFDKSKIKSTFGIAIPHWKESLEACLNQF